MREIYIGNQRSATYSSRAEVGRLTNVRITIPSTLLPLLYNTIINLLLERQQDPLRPLPQTRPHSGNTRSSGRRRRWDRCIVSRHGCRLRDSMSCRSCWAGLDLGGGLDNLPASSYDTAEPFEAELNVDRTAGGGIDVTLRGGYLRGGVESRQG
jgi:hypothetical protein